MAVKWGLVSALEEGLFGLFVASNYLGIVNAFCQENTCLNNKYYY